jgi:hypothetical protein
MSPAEFEPTIPASEQPRLRPRGHGDRYKSTLANTNLLQSVSYESPHNHTTFVFRYGENSQTKLLERYELYV